MPIMRAVLALTLTVALTLAAYYAGQQLGYATGYAKAQQQCQAQTISQQQQVISDVKTLTSQAQKQSLALNQQIEQRKAQDEKTTQEIRHALQQSQGQRSDCRVPVDVMHKLNEARERANRAASASGVSPAMPDAQSARGQ